MKGNNIRLFGCEIEIGTMRAMPDVAVCFPYDQFGHLAAWTGALCQHAKRDSFWHDIRVIAETKRGIPCDWLKLLWVELDHGVFRCDGSGDPALFAEISGNAVSAEQLEKAVIPLLTGKPAPRDMCARLRRCLDILPEAARVAHTGYFPSRSQRHIRLTVIMPGIHDIREFCEKFFGKTIPENIRGTLDAVSPLFDYSVLHLDIGGTPVERLGIEYRFEQNEQSVGYQWRWEKILAYLSGNKLCSGQCLEQLAAFPGIVRYAGSFPVIWYARYLYYIKQVFDFSGHQKFKAYCAFQPLC